MTKIKINNIRFFGYHGVIDYEKKYGNEFEIDVEMKCSLDELKDSDDINRTVDYLNVYKFVEKIFSEKKFNLIETVSQNICRGILENYPEVISVKVKIRKPSAPLGIIDSVEIVNKLKRK